MAKGYFISIEGSEGVGKSTFCQALQQHLQNKGLSVFGCREPGGTEVGKKIRELFLNPPGGEPLTAITELMLILAARAQHVAKEIAPRLARGQIVVCDRYLDSTLLYQGIVGKIPMDQIQEGHRIATAGLMPELTFLLDCPVAVAKARVAARAEAQGDKAEEGNRFDEADDRTYEIYRAGFQTIAAMYPERTRRIDSDQSEAAVLAAAVALLPSEYR